MLRSDKQRRAMFANMNSFSSKAANGYTGIKFSEDPDTFVFDDDIVEEVGESIDIPIEEKPKKVMELAIRGMLPKTKLGRAMFKKLRVYKGSEHPHIAQV